ncbi:two-component system sensor histidine kinase MprB [Kitasatospora sp. GP30]|uniref:sensor histidine kinase n=1 Tax=Kitasatospora sp. GP30 TaxID=3035084 RepID=UPI000CC2050D|nr:HAMP domain-containing sensor histidine kinase [Kitasatospora sp. GP30]MDH6145803.1 two-component system sensor histidine kinase MprB [Kitasatospora sp. GP30]
MTGTGADAQGAQAEMLTTGQIATRSALIRRLSSWFNRMTLRGRLALLAAAAVSLAVVVIAVSGWFVARNEMINQVDQTLAHSWSPNTKNPPVAQIKAMNAWCNGIATQQWMSRDTIPTVISADGSSCPQGDSRAVTVAQDDLPVASSGTTGREALSYFRNGTTTDGKAVRVYVVSFGPVLFEGNSTTAAVAFSQPLQPVQDALDQLTLITSAVATLVIAAAAAGGLWIARTALRPVDRLTQAAEHIARTQEPGVTIDVSGHDEITRLSESFNAMSLALAHSRDSQSRLIADAGHELRTPLASLRTNVDLMVRSEETGRALPEATRTKILGNMKAQMVELSTLIGDLLELSRPSSAKDSRSLVVVPLHDVAAWALDRARLRGPGLVFNVDVNPWYVRADAHALERAVINLLDNAVKFSPSSGAIDVCLSSGTLTIRDHGPGIPAADLPHVFDRFWRSPSARQMPGSGLGLAIVAQAVREAGGKVSLTSVDLGPDGATGGALATVRLPGASVPPSPTPSAPGADDTEPAV